jgi:flagellar motor switch protein FliM
VDQRWMQALQREMQDAEVEMRVELLRRSILVRELLQMRVGDVLPVEMPEIVVARVDGIPVLAGEFGQHDDHMALKVRQRLMSEVVKEQSSLALARR